VEKTKEKESLSIKEQIKVLRFLLQFAKKEKIRFGFAIFFGIVQASVSVSLPFVLKQFMDTHLRQNAYEFGLLLYFALLYLGLSLVNALAQFGRWYLFEQGAVGMGNETRRAIYKKIHTMGLGFFDKTPAGWLITRITSDTDLLQFCFVFIMVLTGLFSFIASFIGLSLIESNLSWILFALLPFLFLAVILYQKLSSVAYQKMRESLSEINTKLNEYLVGIRIIHVFHEQGRITNEFEKNNAHYFKMRQKVIQINSIFLRSFVSFLSNMGMVLSLFFFAQISFTQVVAAGVVYAFITNLQQVFEPIGNMMELLSNFSAGIVQGKRILTVMETDGENPFNDEGSQRKIQLGKIEFRHVGFSYDGLTKVLDDVSFIVQPGETLAIVGHTGSGKSTIINVLMRFYEFQTGDILIDDISIRQFSKKELREKVGLILQDSQLFVGSVRENIRFMHPNLSEEDLMEASRLSQAHHFIEKLEAGYDEAVVEGGQAFSQGEKQLLSFARTIALDPKILVLDEATANVDSQTEYQIQVALKKMRKNRTTLAIAHRLSTIRDADNILVMDHGAVVEAGNHEELMDLNGLYKEMYQLQMERGKQNI
jgi:ATP-binding cassette subfamily B protein